MSYSDQSDHSAHDEESQYDIVSVSCTENDPLIRKTQGSIVTNERQRQDIQPHATIIFLYTLMFAATLLFSASSFFVHWAEVKCQFPLSLSVFVRGTIQTILSVCFCAFSPPLQNALRNITRSQFLCVLVRSIAGTLSITALYGAVKLLPVGDAIAVYSANPAVSVALAAMIFHECVPFRHVGAAIIAAIGAACVSLPNGFNSLHLFSGQSNEHALGVGLAISAAVLAGVSLTALRKLSLNSHFMVAVMAFGVSGFVTGFPFILNLPGGLTQKEYIHGGAFISEAAICGFLGQCCISRALKDCPVAPAAIFLNLEVPMSYMLGLMFLGEQPTTIQSVGSSLIVLSTLFIRLS